MISASTIAATRFPSQPESSWVARTWVHEALCSELDPEHCGRLEALVAALVADAVSHCDRAIEVELVRYDHEVEAAVTTFDRGGSNAPSDRTYVLGEGLALAEALATSSGVTRLPQRHAIRVWGRI